MFERWFDDWNGNAICETGGVGDGRGSSQASKSAGARITGIRLWIGASSSFASVVMIVNVSTGSGRCSHRSHKPARLRGDPSLASMSLGCIRVPSF